jgi:hypothetical protein
MRGKHNTMGYIFNIPPHPNPLPGEEREIRAEQY